MSVQYMHNTRYWLSHSIIIELFSWNP